MLANGGGNKVLLIISRLQCRMNPFSKNFLFFAEAERVGQSSVSRVSARSLKGFGQKCQVCIGKTSCFTSERLVECDD